MSRRIHFFAGALLSAACLHCGPKFQEPVGRTTERATPPPAQGPSTATAADGGSEAVGANTGGDSDGDSSANVEGEGACGTDPPVIAFEGASTNIDETQERVLRRLAKCLDEPALETASVVLIGYTDIIGTVPANLELGLARAQVVMKLLVSSGVAPGRIVVASAGELQRPRARRGLHAPRVEILLTHGGPTRPNEAPITRGIDAEGLIPRAPQPSSSPSSPVKAAPPPRPRARKP